MLTTIALVVSFIAIVVQWLAIWSQREVIKSYRMAHDTWKELSEDRFKQISQLTGMVNNKTRENALLQGQLDDSQSKLRDIANFATDPNSSWGSCHAHATAPAMVIEPGVKIRTPLQLGEEYSFPVDQFKLVSLAGTVLTDPDKRKRYDETGCADSDSPISGAQKIVAELVNQAMLQMEMPDNPIRWMQEQIDALRTKLRSVIAGHERKLKRLNDRLEKFTKTNTKSKNKPVRCEERFDSRCRLICGGAGG